MKYIFREVENRLVHVFFLRGTFQNEYRPSLCFSSYETGMKAQGLKDESNRTQGKQENGLLCIWDVKLCKGL